VSPPNKLLARLSRADAQLLEPHLSPIELPVRKQLQAANRRVDRIYFPETGIASIVSNGTNPIEVGMIGREGMSGASAPLAFGAWEAEPRIAASFAAQRGRPGVGFPVT
jgi:hypothetical protein